MIQSYCFSRGSLFLLSALFKHYIVVVIVIVGTEQSRGRGAQNRLRRTLGLDLLILGPRGPFTLTAIENLLA
jgi:hypothetical protein